MHRLPQKARFQCPGCGFFQLEPPDLISTYCRSCGGRLEAEVHSRSVRVEKGGALLGTCHVNETQPEDSGKPFFSNREVLWPEHLCPAC